MDQSSEVATTGGDVDGTDRPAYGYALLFSLPVLVGVTLMMTRVTGGRPLSLVLAPGVVLGGVVFLFVVVLTRDGYEA